MKNWHLFAGDKSEVKGKNLGLLIGQQTGKISSCSAQPELQCAGDDNIAGALKRIV